VATIAAVAVTYTPLFAADRISVQGTTLPDAEILAIAGVGSATNVFHLDEGSVELRLEDDPRILSATVRTSLPDAISISIVPRMPVAIADGSLVGEDGVVIAPALVETAALPRISGDVRAGAAAAGAMSVELRRAARTIVVAADGRIAVRLEQGFTADLGDGTQLSAKAASLAALLGWAADNGVTIASADVTAPGSPTVELDRGDTVSPST
jgi:cell division septal protein FtsQ